MVNAPVLIPAPTREPLPFGVASVADVIDDATPRWVFGGAQAEIDSCLVDLGVAADACAPGQTEVLTLDAAEDGMTVEITATGDVSGTAIPAKTTGSVYGLIEAEPTTLYLIDGCQTLNRFDDAEARARRAFEVGEAAGLDILWITSVLADAPVDIGSDADCLAEAIGVVEEWAALNWMTRPTVYIPRRLAPFGFRDSVLTRVGDRLETSTGSRVALLAGDAEERVYVSGPVDIHRSPLAIVGPVFNPVDNTYLVLAERSYLPLVACGVAYVGVTDGCGGTP